MQNAAVLVNVASSNGFLLVLAIILPVAGILLSLALGGRYVERIALIFLPASFGIAATIFAILWQSGQPLVYIVGGWAPPLGIALRADGDLGGDDGHNGHRNLRHRHLCSR